MKTCSEKIPEIKDEIKTTTKWPWMLTWSIVTKKSL